MPSLFLLLLSLLLLSPRAFAQIPPPPTFPGAPCFLGGFLPRACPSRLTCVLSDFGNPPVDAPRVGACQLLSEKPPTPACSVPLCAASGPDTLCVAPFQLVATCAAWAKRDDLGGVKPDCNLVCTEQCRTPKLVASDGSEYCNRCKLQAASCRSNFRIFGPVRKKKPTCKKPISIFEAAKCCIERGVGCLAKGKRCSTAGSRIQPVPCKKGLTCVISDFGFPAADRPNSGRCRRVRRVQKCSVAKCTRFGPRYVCAVPKPRGCGIVSTCKAWARRSDGNPRPDCAFFCPAICAVGDARPLASNGKRFCSICALRQKSCATDFMVFGPVKAK